MGVRVKSGDIEVQIFREILIFPLRLDKFGQKRALAAHMAGLDPRVWRPIKSLETVLPSRIWPPKDYNGRQTGQTTEGRTLEDSWSFKRRQDYAEAAYFHPFVQRFLYGDTAEDGSAHLVTFRREGIRSLIVEASYDWGGLPSDADSSFAGYSIELDVERINCHYVRDPGMVIFSMELAANHQTMVTRIRHDKTSIEAPLSLAEVLSLKDCLRRSFPPYFTGPSPGDRDLGWNQALFPTAITLTGPGFPEQRRLALDQDGISGMIDQMLKADQIHPLAPWWQEIFAGFNIDGGEDRGPLLRQTGDERMQTLSCVAIRSLEMIGRPDLVRLCFADIPGTDYPYDPDFLATFEADHCYDRFKHLGTRYLVSSYAATLLMQTDVAKPDPEHFTFALDVLQEHVRRHYFRLVLMIQINKTGLLAFSSWLSAAMRHHGSLRSVRYRQEVSDLRRGFMEFSQISWFSNVSNQQQARELYDALMRHAGNPDLYQEVAAELEQARSELAEIDTAKQAEAGTGLNVIALVASSVGLFLTYAQLDTSLFGDGQPLKGQLHFALGIVLLLSGVLAMLITFLSFEGGWRKRRLRRQSVRERLKETGRVGYLLSLATMISGVLVLMLG